MNTKCFKYLNASLINNYSFISVPTLTNGVTKDSGDVSGTENFIKCPQCQKGCSTFQTLKEHIESCHSLSEEGNPVALLPPSTGPSPPPGAVAAGGSFGCSQCTTTFTSKDQLEKHELLHSPNAQVVSLFYHCIKLILEG